MSQEKREGAMRIFEALSGVDEELLARSEEGYPADGEQAKPSQRKRVSGKRVLLFAPGTGKYGRVLTAAVCFIVLGVLAFGATRVSNSTKGTNQAPAMEMANKIEMAADVEGAGAPDMEGAGAADVKEAAPQEAESTLSEEGMGSEALIANAAEKLNTITLSETEAGSLADFGAYVPQCIPEGFGFSEAQLTETENGSGKTLFISFAKGMDYIEFVIEHGDSTLHQRMADIEKPETYDVRLYEIPYGESVPEEYYQVFHYPVFRKQDLSADIVNARIENITDLGDTSSPRANFAVYFEEENILVEYRGRAKAEEILEMLQSIPAENP